MSATRDVMVSVPSKEVLSKHIKRATSSTALWSESLDTPGIVPRHLLRSASASFPIFEVIQRILRRLGLNGTIGDLEKVLALVGFYNAVKPAYNCLKDFFWWACTAQITISESDPVAKEVLAWMGAEVKYNSHARRAMLVTGNSIDVEDSFTKFSLQLQQRGPTRVQNRIEEKPTCLPSIGTRMFWIGLRPFFFSRSGGSRSSGSALGMTLNTRGEVQNALTITTLGWSLVPLVKFADLCHEFHLKNQAGTTTIHLAGSGGDQYGGEWQSISKAIRKLDTIDMDEDIKLDVVKDAEHYYSVQSRQFFADCGIPYRRGYLFFGPPGTGKSSFTAALAGHLRCDIYQINLASGNLSDSSLHRTFLRLPKKCIVLIEDIDSAGVDREQGPLAQEPKADTSTNTELLIAMNVPLPTSRRPAKSHGKTTRSMVTLSGLLNAIDGTSSQEGRLLIMTSNSPDTLDPALTRPGRIDKKVYFGNMSKAAGKSIFMRLMGRSAIAHNTAFSMDNIEQYANEFADRIPANIFTPAQIQNFLQDYRGDARKALGEIDDWVLKNQDNP